MNRAADRAGHGRSVHVLAFFFEDRDGGKIAVACRAKADLANSLDGAFEQALRTFALDP